MLKLAGYVMKKWKKISGFRHNIAIFQAQLSAEQTAHEQVTNTLELMRQELEALKEAQNGPNPMDFSVTDNADLNRERDRGNRKNENWQKNWKELKPSTNKLSLTKIVKSV